MFKMTFVNKMGMVAGLLMALTLGGLAGCESAAATMDAPAQVAGQPGTGQQLFATDDQAAAALIDAVKANDRDTLRHTLGPATRELVSGDPVEDANDFATFSQRAGERLTLEKKSDVLTVLHLGAQDWPFAIPLVKTADGQWFFDTAAGKQEILARRIGANELETIAVCRTYVQAQREYASKDRDGNEVLNYAQRFMSTPGKKDGLYWETAPGEQPSPLGPLVAQATNEGYLPKKAAGPQPFHGYFFHILTQQGLAAPGGRYNYVINDNMIAGFALVAWPADYGNSGVMTFIISHQGKLYQKDLGPESAQLGKQMTQYNPDSTWTLVKE